MSRLDRVKDWTQRAKEAHFRAGELAIICQVSFSQLRRFTLVKFGVTPQRWLDMIRLQEAASLILTSKASLKEIALDLQFADQRHLAHKFRRYYGCKPSEYGSNSRRRSAIRDPGGARAGWSDRN